MAVENCPSSINRITGKCVLFPVRSPWVADLKALPPKHTLVSLDHWKKELSQVSSLQGSLLSVSRRLQPIRALSWGWPGPPRRRWPASCRASSASAAALCPAMHSWVSTAQHKLQAVTCIPHNHPGVQGLSDRAKSTMLFLLFPLLSGMPYFWRSGIQKVWYLWCSVWVTNTILGHRYSHINSQDWGILFGSGGKHRTCREQGILPSAGRYLSCSAVTFTRSSLTEELLQSLIRKLHYVGLFSQIQRRQRY